MDLRLKDRVAVVTGGTAGIGLATVRRFLAEGARVAFCGRDPGRIASVQSALSAEYGDSAFGMPCDVLVEPELAQFGAAVAKRFGQVDALVNNAGRSRMIPFAETDDETWQAELSFKFFSILRPLRTFQPWLERSDAASIVVVNSLVALQPEPRLVATSAARGGVHNLVRSLCAELAPKRIRVNSVLLGTIESGQWERRYEGQAARGVSRSDWYVSEAQKRGIPWQRFGRPDEVAAVVVFLCSPLAEYMTGAAVDISGGMNRHV